VGGENRPIVELESAVRNRWKTFWVSGFDDELSDVVTFLGTVKSILREKITEQLRDNALKINIILRCRFVKDEQSDDRCFKTMSVRVFQADDVDEILDLLYSKLLKEKSEHQGKGSGWILSLVLGLELRINKYTPLRGSTYIELPEKIKNTGAVINVKNTDLFCFKYAIWSKNI
jgi:hypothetical protein